MATRTATCGCGRVHVTVEGEPALIAACHCDFCKKRTGSAFGYQAYFNSDQCVETVGETKVYNGIEVDGAESQAGREQTPKYHFCTTCGSTVYYSVGDGFGHTLISVAIGNFVDPDFPAPNREYYTTMRHHWVSPATTAEQFRRYPEGPDRLQQLGG
jgi:hypothetical protein